MSCGLHVLLDSLLLRWHVFLLLLSYMTHAAVPYHKRMKSLHCAHGVSAAVELSHHRLLHTQSACLTAL